MSSAYFFLQVIRKKRRKNKSKVLKLDYSVSPELNNSPFTASDINRCRVCLKEGTIPIYGDENRPDLSEHIQIFGDIQVSKDDEHPKVLCDHCNLLLQGAIIFRNSAKESDAILREANIDKTFVESEEALFEEDGSPEEIKEKPKRYYCKLCKLSFKSMEEYTKHKSTRKHKNVRIQCPICFGLLTKQLYHKHLLRHQSATHLVCDVCGKMYRKDNLIRHLQLHNFDFPFQCKLCPYKGRFAESLKIHMRSHTGDKPFACETCQMRFLTRSNLNRHILTHTKERPFKCTDCDRGFYTKKDMDVHFKSDHVGIKDFGCKICGSKYGSKKALMRHELRVHKRNKMARGRMPLYLQAQDGNDVGSQ